MKNLQGWVKLHRKITDSIIYQMPPLYLRVFERLVIEANHSDKYIFFNGEKKLIQRGERVTSIRQISEWVGWFERGKVKIPNPKTITKILEVLKKENIIAVLGNTQHTHYKVLNYSIYQGSNIDKVTVDGEVDGEVGKQLLDTNKNVKNVKNEKKKETFFECVNLTDDEHRKLIDEFGDSAKDKIESLSLYIKSRGDKYKSHYHTILAWDRKDKEREKKSNISYIPKRDVRMG